MLKDTRWARELETRMDEVADDEDAGKKPIGEGERTMGIMSDDLRRIACVRNAVRSQLEERSSRHACPSSDCTNFRAQVRALTNQYNLLNDLFWSIVEQELDCRGDDLEIRKGNQIVKTAEKPRTARSGGIMILIS